MEQISSGAEAIIFRDGDAIVKERVVKDYRLKQIDDSLRKFRTRREAKVLGKLNDLGVRVPKLISMCDKNMKINMEFVSGSKLRDVLTIEHGHEIGKMLAFMHKNDIIHGDLTTSNMILRSGELYFIDFGLSAFSSKVEDKAVDLHLLSRALESKHNSIFEACFEAVLKGYSSNYTDFSPVLLRLEKVAGRGRNKGK